MKASAAIQVLPAVQEPEKMLEIVDAVIEYIKSTGFTYSVGPFETTIECDDYEPLMEVIKNCQLVAVRHGCKKVSAYIKVVYQPDGNLLSIHDKTEKYKS